MDLKDKKVTVIGLGQSGFAAASLLSDIGASAGVSDSGAAGSVRVNAEALVKRGVKVETGGHTRGFIEGSALVVASPGVEDSSLPFRWAGEMRIPVISELELGFRYCRGTIIAITGTNGKSTVTTLIGEILKNGGHDTVVCGNIGNALSGEVSRIAAGTYVVLEVSSFQLERAETFRPHIAVILNITDDHLDRYTNFKGYFCEKMKIFRNQTADDLLILNYDAVNLRPLEDAAESRTLFYSRLEKVEGAYVKGDRAVVSLAGIEEEELFSANAVRLKGLHNLENVLASALVGRLCGVGRDSLRRTIGCFRGLSHRFETVGVIDSVEYIDDSKGTTVDSTIRALESCDKPVILIAGGKDKNSDYGPVENLIRKKVQHLILIGEAAGKIRRTLRGAAEIHEAGTMQDAVETAHSLASAGEAVLLSPMCSSFDMFRDYKERGDVFKEAVRGLKARGRRAGG